MLPAGTAIWDPVPLDRDVPQILVIEPADVLAALEGLGEPQATIDGLLDNLKLSLLH